jgi:hypothetical protein
MRIKPKVRFWVGGPFLFYLFVFLLWFPRWQHASHTFSTRLLTLLFGAMTAVLMIIGILGGFFSPLGFGPFAKMAAEAYETFFKKDSNKDPATGNRTSLIGVNRPPMMVTKQLQDGTPVRVACPLCDLEFSTEAFEGDRTYAHKNTLEKWYGEHFESHIVNGDL